jgi:hypothetical protein
MFTPDWSNPVIAAVGRGAQAEMTGDRDGARAAYTEAWNAAKDDLERCIAAHFVPRTLEDPRDKLRWNEDALRYAAAVDDGRTMGFFASLHASVGQARLGLGDTNGAQAALRLAETNLASVPDGPYKNGLIEAIHALRQACLDAGWEARAQDVRHHGHEPLLDERGPCPYFGEDAKIDPEGKPTRYQCACCLRRSVPSYGR